MIKTVVKTILPNPKFKIDETLGYQIEIDNLRKLIKHKKWEMIENHLKTMSSSELELVINYLITTSTEDTYLIKQWYHERPKEFYPTIIYANYFIHWAWDARGSGYADGVEQEAWAIFFERLNEAYNLIHEAIELNPNHPKPYNMLLTLSMTSASNGININEVISKLNSIDKEDYGVQKSIIYALTERWQGEKGDAINYAYTACKDAPKGSSLYALIPYAHIERWMDFGSEEREESNKFFMKNGVRQNILDAYQEAFPNQNFRDDVDSLDALNQFAFCFYLTKNTKELNTILHFLQGRLTEYPWVYKFWFSISTYGYSMIYHKYLVKSFF